MLAAHKFYNTDGEARVNFVSLYLHWVHERVLEPILVLLSGEAEASACIEIPYNPSRTTL